ncbi:uncharacterized protein LOC120666914 [Panicum virgatum]|uniref:uncharacterized protein LOC120666914 n=1 Tax=Panicum virgatum TaxID=38727 RepID=UPI0019D5378A|nr:uncharacterized protein LOC120666914 [Panicum virgatum]XP_039802836.1 uncharacterized protein LOC120666914 [Panicum virgatum]
MLFQDRAMQLIGKPAEKLLTTYRKSDNPLEISALIGQKFTFIDRVLSEKKLIAYNPTFEVVNIKIERQPASCATSTSEEHNLPPLVPICPKPWQNKSSYSSSQQNYNIDDRQTELTEILQDKTIRKALDIKNEEQLEDTHKRNISVREPKGHIHRSKPVIEATHFFVTLLDMYLYRCISYNLSLQSLWYNAKFGVLVNALYFVVRMVNLTRQML